MSQARRVNKPVPESVCLSVFRSLSLCLCMYVCLSVPVCLSLVSSLSSCVCLCMSISVCLSMYVFEYVYMCLRMSASVCVSIFTSIFASVCMSDYLLVCKLLNYLNCCFCDYLNLRLYLMVLPRLISKGSFIYTHVIACIILSLCSYGRLSLYQSLNLRLQVS